MNKDNQGDKTFDNETLIKARVLDRLIDHLDNHKEVQNIDLMILAKFCRNCLSKWMAAEAQELGEDLDLDAAKKVVYKMDPKEWKEKYQKAATQEQLDAFNALK
ncbi:DUF1244 domain-containing protein [Marinicella sp. S1101]|uniref:DUF1244 domain-containing protein n=1 Tax=Marinicella marina TaxID=2996016 RepID=UPI00226089E7|nr:DUF1244 domain-containing protein [Marinicella marina]MCX7555116.1 DUF1244 domain-containing protein [Marinicella marina]MDJ1140325.1 DUF1244 domain-containing protein [Marinicella marina]